MTSEDWGQGSRRIDETQNPIENLRVALQQFIAVCVRFVQKLRSVFTVPFLLDLFCVFREVQTSYYTAEVKQGEGRWIAECIGNLFWRWGYWPWD